MVSSFVGGSSRKAMFVVLAVLGLASAAIIARGQNTPTPDAQTETGATLTNDQIGQALDTYGKNATTTNGHTEYSINVPKGKWNLNVLISVSPNGKVIWVTNGLAAMPDAGKVSAAALESVLEKNTEIGPMFFSIASGSLRLSYPIPNYDLTAASFRADVDALVSTVVDTAPLWDPNFLAGNTAGAQPAAPSANPSGH